MSDLLEARQHRLTIECERGRYLCYADPVRLSQVFANLLSNAARYTDPSGDINVRVEETEGDVVVTVQDNGMGVSPEMLPRVFHLFEQGKRSSDRAQGGLGIGLALVKNLVGLHGGSVSVRSDGARCGSEFTVRLPAAVGTELSAPTKQARSGFRTASSRRVLVVDDNVDAAELLEATLVQAGHDAAMATDPLTALDIAARFAPDVAILDIGLPVVDGYELAARLRDVPGCAQCRAHRLDGVRAGARRTAKPECRVRGTPGETGGYCRPAETGRLPARARRPARTRLSRGEFRRGAARRPARRDHLDLISASAGIARVTDKTE